MMDRLNSWRALSRRFVVVTTSLLASVALAMLPGEVIAPARDALCKALRPGQMAAAGLRARVVSVMRSEGDGGVDDKQLRAAQRKIRELEAQVRRLNAREAGQGAEDDSGGTEPLLSSRLVPARILGQQGRAFLQRRELLRLPQGSPAHPGALVIDDNATVLDQGDRAGVQSGELVLAGRRVLGKIDQVRGQASTMRAMTAEGYRDVVRIIHVDEKTNDAGARGILVGVGESLCRIQMVDVTEPIVVGDLVYSAAAEGVAAGWPVCGTVVRVDRRAGAAHWEIWMRPAADARRMDRAAVLCVKLKRHRISTARPTAHPK